MNIAQPIFVGIAIAVLGSLLRALWIVNPASRTRNEYFFADGKLRVRDVGHLLLSSSFSMNGLLYQAWLGYQIGLAAVLMQVVWCISYFWMAGRAETIATFKQGESLHAHIGSVFGNAAKRVGAIATVVGFALQVGWELLVGVLAFASVAPNSDVLRLGLMLAMAIVAAGYTMAGGIGTDAIVNRLQNWGGMIALTVLWLFLLGGLPTQACIGELCKIDPGIRPFDGIGATMGRFVPVLGVIGFATNVVFSLLWQFVDMTTWQSFSASNYRPESIRRALQWSSLAVWLFPGLLGTLLGMWMRSAVGLTSDNIIISMLGVAGAKGGYALLVAVGAGMAAAMLSTIDGLLLAASQAWVEDVAGTPTDDKSGLRRSRKMVLILAILAAVAFFGLDRLKVGAFKLVYIVVLAQMCLVPCVLTILYSGKRGRRGGATSIAAGLAVGLIIVAVWYNNDTALSFAPLAALGAAFLALWIGKELNLP